jgi:hypothetical protein
MDNRESRDIPVLQLLRRSTLQSTCHRLGSGTMRIRQIVKQSQKGPCVIALAFMLNIQFALGQVQSRSTYPAPIIIPSSESWLFSPISSLISILLTPSGTAMTALGHHSFFKLEHPRRQLSSCPQQHRMKHGPSTPRGVNQEISPIVTP